MKTYLPSTSQLRKAVTDCFHPSHDNASHSAVRSRQMEGYRDVHSHSLGQRSGGTMRRICDNTFQALKKSFLTSKKLRSDTVIELQENEAPTTVHISQDQHQRTYDAPTMKWGTLEKPRKKGGKSTIKDYECDPATGKPKIIDGMFSIDLNRKEDFPQFREESVKLLAALNTVQEGTLPLVWGVSENEHFKAAVQTVVPDIQDKHGQPAHLGHVNLGEEEMRISGEGSKMQFDEGHPQYDANEPEKSRRVLINKSGRFGKEGWRTPEHLLNVHAALAKRGAEFDEVIFRGKKDGVTTDTVMWSVFGNAKGHSAVTTE